MTRSTKSGMTRALVITQLDWVIHVYYSLWIPDQVRNDKEPQGRNDKEAQVRDDTSLSLPRLTW